LASPELFSSVEASLFPTRPGIDYGPLDERETDERDHVHYVAYTLARWLALFLFVLYGLLGAIHVPWFGHVGPFFFLLLTLVLWSLPQTLILWTEPDMEE
jgi:hypothetical protein